MKGTARLILAVWLVNCGVTWSRHSSAKSPHVVGESIDERRQNLQEGTVGNRVGSVDEVNTGNKIPHILHYIFLSGFDQFVDSTEDPKSRMQKKYYDSCLEAHPRWEVKFWDKEKAEEFVRTHYSWFMPVWDSYDMEVKKADALRPFILYHYGGLYLDLDNECYGPADKVFKQYDVVLQGSGWEGVNNGMMASAPGHPLWMTLVDVLTERHEGSATIPTRNLPLYMTGPSVLAEATKRYLKQLVPVSGFASKEYKLDDRTVKLYSLGEFFMPCWESDLVCQRQLERGLAKGYWDSTNLVGRHWFAGTWNRPDLLFPGKQKKLL